MIEHNPVEIGNNRNNRHNETSATCAKKEEAVKPVSVIIKTEQSRTLSPRHHQRFGKRTDPMINLRRPVLRGHLIVEVHSDYQRENNLEIHAERTELKIMNITSMRSVRCHT